MQAEATLSTRLENADPGAYIEALKRDGFVVFPGFFSPETADEARRELEPWFDRDVRERIEKNTRSVNTYGVAGRTQLDEFAHLLIDVFAKSPTLDMMFESILTDPTVAEVHRRLVGEHFKVRGYNVRRMTGAVNPPPAQAWHRDSPGEIGWGILLTDVPEYGHSATKLLPGSHLFPYCARTHLYFSEAYYGHKRPMTLKFNLFNRLLARRVFTKASGGYGVRGSFYIFINDVWHGRDPNLFGSRSMVVLVGAFPTEVPFPDDVKLPPDEEQSALPPTFRMVLQHDQPLNEGRTVLIYDMLADRQRFGAPGLFRLARMERQAFDAMWGMRARMSSVRQALRRRVGSV